MTREYFRRPYFTFRQELCYCKSVNNPCREICPLDCFFCSVREKNIIVSSNVLTTSAFFRERIGGDP